MSVIGWAYTVGTVFSLLADRNQIHFIHQWLCAPHETNDEWSVLHAAQRDPFPGSPIPFAPPSALR